MVENIQRPLVVHTGITPAQIQLCVTPEMTDMCAYKRPKTYQYQRSQGELNEYDRHERQQYELQQHKPQHS